MARCGNKNAQKHPPWLDYSLKTRDEIDQFIQEEVRAIWTGKLGTRQASAINGSIRLLMEARGWIQKSAFQVTQTQKASADPAMIIAGFIETLPRGLRTQIAAHVQQQARLEQDQ